MAIKSVSTGLLVLLLVGGCGQGAAPETVEVTGTVTYRGEPVELGRVTFQPQGSEDTRPAVGNLKAGGTYALSTYAAGDGAKPGSYKVLIESYRGGASPENPRAQKEWVVPEKYSKSETSQLTATVPADGTDRVELDFDLD